MRIGWLAVAEVFEHTLWTNNDQECWVRRLPDALVADVGLTMTASVWPPSRHLSDGPTSG